MQLLPVILLIYASIFPQEVRLSISGQTFFLWRIVGIALLPWAISILSRRLVKLRSWDVLLGISAFWMVFAFMAYYGPAQGAVRGLALAIDVVIPYFIARTCIRSLDDFRIILIAAAPGLAFAGLSMLLESILSRPLVRPAFASVFGDLPRYEDGAVASTEGSYSSDRRLGLLRASGPFAHPILAGLFLASFLPLYLQSGMRRWPIYVGVLAALCGFFSLSSAAFLMMILGIGLVVVDWFQNRTTFLSWRLIVPGAIAVLLAAQLASESGLVKFISRFTLDPQTAYFRQLIWEYGMISVQKNPWIGIGFDNYERLSWMVSSVDNHWLSMAIRFGVISPLAMLACVIWIMWALGRSSGMASPVDRRTYVGISIALFGVSILGFTVAFFGGFQSWFFILLGSAASVAAERTNSAPARSPRPRRPVRVVTPVIAREPAGSDQS